MINIKKIAPILSGIKKENPFRVPDGYFNNFSSRISEKIHTGKIPGFYKKYVLTIKPYLAIAALFIGVVITGTIFYNVLVPGNNTQEYNSNEVAELINENTYYLSEESILEIVDLNDAKSGYGKVENEGDNLTNEVIDYLIDEGIDIIDIVEAL